MPVLAASSVSLRDPDGSNITVFSVDPTRYDPFANARRGSSHKVLSGSVIHQDFGVQQSDFIISLDAEITDHITFRDLFAKYRSRAKIWQLQDWFPNTFNVVFAPGQQSFHAVPIRGSCTSYECSMTFYVIQVVSWFNGAY